MTANHWLPLAGVDNVYYLASPIAKSGERQSFPLFETLTIKTDVTTLSAYQNKTVKITAYAIQSTGTGLDTPANAWTTSGFGN